MNSENACYYSAQNLLMVQCPKH